MNDRRIILLTQDEVRKVGGTELTANCQDIIQTLYLPVCGRFPEYSGTTPWITLEFCNNDGSAFSGSKKK